MPGLALLASATDDTARIASVLLEHRGRGFSLVYWEDGEGGSGLRMETLLNIDSIPYLAGRGVVMATYADWTCVHALRLVGGHALAHVVVCAARVPHQTQYATSLPVNLRKNPLARLMGYAWRLLDEGSSTERLAARLVKLGARAAIVAVVAEQSRRRTPVAIMAAERMCIAHYGRWAAASTRSLPGCTLLEDKLVTLKLQAGVPRMSIGDIDEYGR